MVDRNITSQHFPVQPWPPFVNRINRGDRTAAFWQTVLYDEVPLLAGWSRRGNRREREARLDPSEPVVTGSLRAAKSRSYSITLSYLVNKSPSFS